MIEKEIEILKKLAHIININEIEAVLVLSPFALRNCIRYGCCKEVKSRQNEFKQFVNDRFI
jgi:hypothetical protein